MNIFVLVLMFKRLIVQIINGILFLCVQVATKEQILLMFQQN